MDNAELFDAEHPLATLRQLIERGAPHAAKSYNDGVPYFRVLAIVAFPAP